MKPCMVDALLFGCAVAFTTLAAWCGGAEFGTSQFRDAMFGGAIGGVAIMVWRMAVRDA